MQCCHHGADHAECNYGGAEELTATYSSRLKSDECLRKPVFGMCHALSEQQPAQKATGKNWQLFRNKRNPLRWLKVRKQWQHCYAILCAN